MSSSPALTVQRLPQPAPATVLAVGAWLKNTACLLHGDTVWWSPLHGDLGTPQACAALAASLQALQALQGAGSGPGRSIAAVAHDLHPDFESTRLAQALAHELGVPALPVQHHHAHLGVVMAEQGLGAAGAPLLGWALDGVGLGTDGLAWGGELLLAQGGQWQRLAHLPPLALPGGDIAAREPWRMAAALLQRLGRADEIAPRLAPLVGERLAHGVQQMLARDLHCPRTTSAGRWFDALAGLLRLNVRQRHEAEAAIALEQAAAAWLASPQGMAWIEAERAAAAPLSASELAATLDALALHCLARADRGEIGQAAARFHLGLADLLAAQALQAQRAQQAHTPGAAPLTVALTGGCFHNRVLATRLTQRLQAAGGAVLRPGACGPGDAGLALGQAWIAAQQVAASAPALRAASANSIQETLACA